MRQVITMGGVVFRRGVKLLFLSELCLHWVILFAELTTEKI